MIPFEAALIGWIIVSFLLMMMRDSALAFSLAYIGGMIVLPAGGYIDLPSMPDLDKDNVTGIGVLLGTIVFRPEFFDRYKFSIADLLLVALMLLHLLTSVVNGFGVYDGVSQMGTITSTMVLPLFLARLHLGSLQGIKTFLFTLVVGACVMVPFAALEFRLSPQFHTWTYGYFQHVFAQHYRGGFWRPILFFSHALALGRFFAFTAFLAFLPMRRDLMQHFGPLGKYLFLVPLFGLLLSQSYGPYLFFVLLCAGYWVLRRAPLFVLLVPVLAFAWLALNMSGAGAGFDVVRHVQEFNPDRADSLQYRLDALDEYRSVILNRPLYGHGGWGHGRISGRATDSQALISLLSRGFLGTIVYFGWWFSALAVAFLVFKRTQGTLFGQRAAAITVLLALAIAITVIDAALEQHVLLLAAALFPVNHWLLANAPLISNAQSIAGSRKPVADGQAPVADGLSQPG